MKKLLPFVLSAIVFGLAMPLYAEHHDGKDGMEAHHKMMIKMADTNGDGKISKEEFNAVHEKMFNEIDANHDGFIDADEMAKAHQARKEKMRKRMKQHKDGGADDASAKSGETPKK